MTARNLYMPRVFLAAAKSQPAEPIALTTLNKLAIRKLCSTRASHYVIPRGDDELGKFYGQAERPISTGQLHALLRFHLPPIKVVVFDWPSYAAVAALGDLILG